MSFKTAIRLLSFLVLVVCARLAIVGCTCDPVYPKDSGADGLDGAPITDGSTPDLPPRDGAADAAPDQPTATGPYGPCPCGADSTCLTSGCETCAPNCFSLADCPPAPSGTAVPECLPQGGGPGGVCVLLCGTMTCPSGMECDTSFSPMPACMVKCSK